MANPSPLAEIVALAFDRALRERDLDVAELLLQALERLMPEAGAGCCWKPLCSPSPIGASRRMIWAHSSARLGLCAAAAAIG
jgi:hypothetical protein